ncbi:MAG: polymer-forming cytoskeletal protein [Lachnospiraceae bacterium]|nr:polymer-forming cytoskeletal protein [Lachnospiraceae bacterium]
MFGKNKNEAFADDSKTKIGTLIGEGTTFDGDLSSPEAIRVDGIVNGNCNCKMKLILGPNGEIKGNITAQSVIISGKVDGDISVLGKLELLSTGKIAGNITASSLIIDEGAYFDGRCTMTTALGNGPQKTLTDKSGENSKDEDKKDSYN